MRRAEREGDGTRPPTTELESYRALPPLPRGPRWVLCCVFPAIMLAKPRVLGLVVVPPLLTGLAVAGQVSAVIALAATVASIAVLALAWRTLTRTNVQRTVPVGDRPRGYAAGTAAWWIDPHYVGQSATAGPCGRGRTLIGVRFSRMHMSAVVVGVFLALLLIGLALGGRWDSFVAALVPAAGVGLTHLYMRGQPGPGPAGRELGFVLLVAGLLLALLLIITLLLTG